MTDSFNPDSFNIDDYIDAYPDFPQKGIIFRDICPLLASSEAMEKAVDIFYEKLAPMRPEGFAGVESRGFLFLALLAKRFNTGAYILRKPGKLPGKLLSKKYALEYGTNELNIQANTPINGKRIVIVDDLLATGGTINASKSLIEQCGGDPIACAVIIHLTGLNGLKAINMPLIALTRYD